MKSVDEGVKLLDERLPGWRTVIDPESLRLEDGCNCILGQLFGNYDKGVDVLGLKPEDVTRYGFYRGRSTWERLTDAWRRAIR